MARTPWRETAFGRAVLGAFGVDDMPDAQARRWIEHRAMTLALPAYLPAIPAAAYRWETRVVYASGSTETARQFIRFNTAVHVVALFFEVTTDDGSGTAPPLNQIDVRVDNLRNNNEFLSSRADQPGNVGPAGYVPASTLDGRVVLFNKVLDDPQAELGFVFRGRFATSSANGFSDDLTISVVAAGNPLGR